MRSLRVFSLSVHLPEHNCVEEPTVREEEGGAGATSLEAKAGGEQVRDPLHSQQECPRSRSHSQGWGRVTLLCLVMGVENLTGEQTRSVAEPKPWETNM